jgi:hypothetical protein
VATSTFKTREATESDFPFIYSTWLKGLRFGNDVYGLIEQHSYFKNYHRVIEVILNRPDTFINVACLADDPTTILGYAVLGPGMIHYVHVKQAFRRFGIAKELCPKDPKRVTHVTKVGWSILREKFPNCIFDPFLN